MRNTNSHYLYEACLNKYLYHNTSLRMYSGPYEVGSPRYFPGLCRVCCPELPNGIHNCSFCLSSLSGSASPRALANTTITPSTLCARQKLSHSIMVLPRAGEVVPQTVRARATTTTKHTNYLQKWWLFASQWWPPQITVGRTLIYTAHSI